MVRYKEKLADMQRKTFSRKPGELLLTSSSKKMTRISLEKLNIKMEEWLQTFTWSCTYFCSWSQVDAWFKLPSNLCLSYTKLHLFVTQALWCSLPFFWLAATPKTEGLNTSWVGICLKQQLCARNELIRNIVSHRPNWVKSELLFHKDYLFIKWHHYLKLWPCLILSSTYQQRLYVRK